ncbi:MAG TPA: sugar transferase [Gaiellaceae bacterium]|jgi:exopolysaccharide biosynthesis polyprenyl glycosylphosphotransferase|nr:sugar transferase [Gaiellaceae bacterium]
MKVTEHTPLARVESPRDEAMNVVDERTLEILDYRRRTAVIRRRGWLVRRMLLAGDLTGLALAFLIVQFLYPGGVAATDRVAPSTEVLLFVCTLPGWVVVAKLFGLYDRDEERADHSTADEIMGVLQLVTIGTWLLFIGASLSRLADPSLAKLTSFWALAILLVSLARASARAISRRRLSYLQNTVIVGAGEVGQLIARKFLNHPEYGINLVGFLDSAPKQRRPDLEHLVVLGPVEQLPLLIRRLDIERVVIAFSNESEQSTVDLVRELKDLDVQVDVAPRLFEVVSGGGTFSTVEGFPVLNLPPLRLSRSSLLLKRSMDIVIAVLALVLFSPAFVIIALAIKCESAGPVLFRQIRMGSVGRPFTIYKFRTMALDADDRKPEFAHMSMHVREGGDPRMFKITGDPRTTRTGRFLRRYSLDELPQLINVAKGEMSLVGPRPLVLDEDAHVKEWARTRLDLKPGMTGLWQVLGRSAIPFGEMVRLDYLYVTRWSLLTDVKLILRTVPAIFRTGDG